MKTLAVVIGNNNYHASAKLNYAIADAQGMADVFSRLGYDLIYTEDANNNESDDILRALEERIANYDATIFYFAGHGFQYNGENYLTTIECQIPPADSYNCKRNSILLSDLLSIFKKHPDKINIVIIDACRRSFDRGIDATFAPVQAPKGTLVAFSTSPGDGAKDGGFGNHGVYTGALLQYIGREHVSVEELFKKVRRTVSNLTGGTQTPWEHTSLIGDFWFNTGQLVHSTNIPYSEEVVKDVNFNVNEENIRKLIGDLRTQNWYRQNPAIEKLLSLPANSLDPNLQFVLGRNLVQLAAGSEFASIQFFTDLKSRINKYTSKGENHVLNGILFEMYFNKYGEFRKDSFKNSQLQQIMSIRKDQTFANSFDFIRQALLPFKDVSLFWMPTSSDNKLDIDVNAQQEKIKDWYGNESTYDVINRIIFGTEDITEEISQRYNLEDQNELGLKKILADYLSAPEELIDIHSNIPLNKIDIKRKKVVNDFPY